GPGAEGRSGAGDDHGAGAALDLAGHRGPQVVAVRHVQRVAALVPVDLDEMGSRSTARPRASPTAPARAAFGPRVPPSPTPRTPSGLAAGLDTCPMDSSGTSPEVGIR